MILDEVLPPPVLVMRWSRAEQIGAVDQPADGIERSGLGVVPAEVDVVVGGHRVKEVERARNQRPSAF
jgi:hypothetical protein